MSRPEEKKGSGSFCRNGPEGASHKRVLTPFSLGIRRWLVSGLGLGYAPIASGTFGSALACAVALGVWGAFKLAGGNLAALDAVWLGLTLAASVLCVRWGPWAIEYYAGRSRKAGDPGVVVIDELAGQWLALVAIPMPTLTSALVVLAVQFLLFRFFDITKPPPARRCERLPMGWGILCDDLVAGLFANIVGQIVFRAGIL